MKEVLGMYSENYIARLSKRFGIEARHGRSAVTLLLLLGTGQTIAGTTNIRNQATNFEVIKGADSPVCEALRLRLNAAKFERSPYCGIPEETKIPGFEPLNREMLTAEQAVELWPRVYWFIKAQDQDAISTEPLPETARALVGTSLLAWKYSPPVSVSNDGKPENILVWQGYGADESDDSCGEKDYFQFRPYTHLSTQLAFVLTDDGKHIDEPGTRKLFGHPATDTSKKSMEALSSPRSFSELGNHVGLISYKGEVYIESFYSEATGDFEGKHKDDPRLGKTLGVFLRKERRTTLICELSLQTRARFATSK